MALLPSLLCGGSKLSRGWVIGDVNTREVNQPIAEVAEFEAIRLI